MGADHCCQQNLQKQYIKEDYKPQNVHFPPTHYAVKIQKPNELPFDLNELRSMHPALSQLPRPSWYPQKETFYIDHTFLILSFGVYYHGEWIRGIPYGQAEIFTKQGEYFKGYLKEGVVQCDKCLFVTSSSKYYIGGASLNQKHAKGKFVDDKYSFEGQWLNNLPHGRKGIQIFPNGDRFQGSFRLGMKQQGIYTWKKGVYDRYEGSFKDNEIHGKGQLRIRNGAIWSGYFDCSRNNLEIKNAICKFEDQVFQGDISDLKPSQSCNIEIYRKQFIGKSITFEGKIFEGKMLIHYDGGMKNRLRDILNKIESGYQNCQKHSQALAAISKRLPEYNIQFWRQGQAQEGVVIVPICGKFIKVSSRQ